jgi:DNA-binding MarR family transcriptional regulator
MSRKSSNPALKPISLLFRQIQGATRRAMEEALRDSDLTAAQANVLTELAYGRPRSNAELARLQSVAPQSMVEILASLERHGLISRPGKPERGRAMPAVLTTKGHSQLLSVHLAMRHVEQRLLNSLSTAEISQLRRLLEACLIGIENESPGTGSD